MLNRLRDDDNKITDSLRIVHLYHFFEPGMGYIENNLPLEEAKLGIKILVLISGKGIWNANRYLNDSENIDLNHSISNPIYIKASLLKQIKLIYDFKPNILFMPYLDIMIFPLTLLKFVLNYRIVSTIGMTIDVNRLSILKYVFYKLILFISKLYLSNYVDLFVECTFANLDRNISIFKIPSDKIKFSPLGCNKLRFKRDENNRSIIRKKYNIQKDNVVFIYGGKLLPEKNIHLLLDCFIVLSKYNQKVKLMLLGNGPKEYESLLKAKILKNCLESNVIWINFVSNEDLPKYYSAADIGVWPGAPSITIQEAMGCNLPIIIKNSTHTSHLIKYKNGYKFDNGKQLYLYMYILARDRNLRIEMGNLSRKLVENELNWECIANNILKLYKNINSHEIHRL